MLQLWRPVILRLVEISLPTLAHEPLTTIKKQMTKSWYSWLTSLYDFWQFQKSHFVICSLYGGIDLWLRVNLDTTYQNYSMTICPLHFEVNNIKWLLLPVMMLKDWLHIYLFHTFTKWFVNKDSFLHTFCQSSQSFLNTFFYIIFISPKKI